MFDIEDYVTSNLSRAREVQSGSGSEMTATCPACGKYGGFYVNVVNGCFLCNKCQFRARTVVGLVAQVEGITWSEARAFIFERSVKLRRKSDIFSLVERVRALRSCDGNEESKQKDVVVEPPDHYVPIFDGERKPKWKIPAYLKQRKIKSHVARDWGLGYCSKGKYGNRLIIPISCPTGTSWTARAMSDDVKGPKYLNPPGADHKRLLIGWHVVRATGDIVLCEGPLDAVRLYQHDVSALALGGKVLHDEQFSLLMNFPRNVAITIMLDPEEDLAPYDIATKLSVYFDSVYIARLPKTKRRGQHVDPGSVSRRVVHDVIDSAERWDGSRTTRIHAIISNARRKARKDREKPLTLGAK